MPIYERAEWILGRNEDPIDPDMAIVDPHHHLWDRPTSRYVADELLADTGSGHNVVQTVFVECSASYDDSAPAHLAPVGETRFVVAQAARARLLGGSPIGGIVGHADLMLGDAVTEVLEAHTDVGAGLFRGVRHGVNWSASDHVKNGHHGPFERQLADPSFRRGIAALGAAGLTFDAWLYFDQLTELADAARAIPETTFVLNHIGGPLGIGPHSGAGRLAMLEAWQQGIAAVAACDNVVCKVGGIGMEHYYGMGWYDLPSPPSSESVAAWWSEIVHFTLDTFGPARVMFESNYPVDRQTLPYTVLWNAFQILADRYDPAEQRAMFHDTAVRTYRLTE